MEPMAAPLILCVTSMSKFAQVMVTGSGSKYPLVISR
jgi:hypothetical protein